MITERDKRMMENARTLSKVSECVALQVGAVLCDENGIAIATGFNQTPKGATKCKDALEQGLYAREKHHAWSLANEVHAEMDCLFKALKMNADFEKCTLYVTHEPCDNCLKHWVFLGLKRIVVGERYGKFSPDLRDGKLIRTDFMN